MGAAAQWNQAHDLCVFAHPPPSLLFISHFSDNSIGDEGARALAEALKQNPTLPSLNLSGMPELNCVKQSNGCGCAMESSSRSVRVRSPPSLPPVHFSFLRQQHWRRGGTGPRRGFEAEPDLALAESLWYA